MKRRPFYWRVLAWVGMASLLMPLAGYLVLRALLAPLPGEWQTTVSIGPLRLAAGVPSMVRLATSHWVAPHLDGLHVATDVGVLQAQWLQDANALRVRCAPCTLRQATPAEPALRAAALELTVQRDFDQLQGLFQLDVQDGGQNGGVSGSWQGALETTRLRVALDVTHAPGPTLQPARGELILPAGQLKWAPQRRQALFWAAPTASH